jgi:FkbM family methyltransferase
VRERFLYKLRGLLVRVDDPPISLDVEGMPLKMPLSHNLPLYLARCPLYSKNLTRLAQAAVAKYPDLAALDIGANIGDSVAFLRRASVRTILCIEGNPAYLRYLRENTASVGGDVTIAPVLLSDSTGELGAELMAADGTGRLSLRSDGAGTVPTVSLDEVLARYPVAGRVKLLKSDTDGFEGHIIRGGLEMLAKHRPVLFFEYDPDLLAGNGMDGLRVLEALQDIGYINALLYDNVGDLLLTLRLDQTDLLAEIHRYFVGHKSRRYLDIAAFHHDDADLFESFRETERAFYRLPASLAGGRAVVPEPWGAPSPVQSSQ